MVRVIKVAGDDDMATAAVGSARRSTRVAGDDERAMQAGRGMTGGALPSLTP